MAKPVSLAWVDAAVARVANLAKLGAGEAALL